MSEASTSEEESKGTATAAIEQETATMTRTTSTQPSIAVATANPSPASNVIGTRNTENELNPSAATIAETDSPSSEPNTQTTALEPEKLQVIDKNASLPHSPVVGTRDALPSQQHATIIDGESPQEQQDTNSQQIVSGVESTEQTSTGEKSSPTTKPTDSLPLTVASPSQIENNDTVGEFQNEYDCMNDAPYDERVGGQQPSLNASHPGSTERTPPLLSQRFAKARANLEATFLPKSRAEPYRLGQTSSGTDQDLKSTPPRFAAAGSAPPTPVPPKLDDDDEEDVFFLQSQNTADIRQRPVQLLLLGLFALVVWICTFCVQTSCQFASVLVPVGSSQNVLSLHYGLWKYSPADSALAGYTYCYPYTHASHVPWVPRWANVLALCAGTFAVCFVWYQLLRPSKTDTTGSPSHQHKRSKYQSTAITSSLLASFGQSLTLFFFAGRLCHDWTCKVSTGSLVCVASSVGWILLAYGLYRHYGQDRILRLEQELSCRSSSSGRLLRNPSGSAYEPPEDTLSENALRQGQLV